jgi:hypothetical protein
MRINISSIVEEQGTVIIVPTSDGLSFQHHAVPKIILTNETAVSSMVVT